MKQSMGFYDFRAWFEEYRENNFSTEGLKALFTYFEEYEEETGIDIEFDPIAICVEYSEYENIADFHSNYDNDLTTIDEIGEYTQVIDIDGTGFIILDY